MKAPSQHIPEDPRLGRAWNEGWNGQPPTWGDQEYQKAWQTGQNDGHAVDAHNAAIWRDTPKDRFGNYIY